MDTLVPTPALSGSGSEGMISARVLRHPYWKVDANIRIGELLCNSPIRIFANMKKILIINGPNLNLLGKRETSVYGNKKFEDYLKTLKPVFPDAAISYFQSNIEGEIIDALQKADGKYAGVILNAGGYTHTSVAIGDAVKAISVPVIEVHISNVYAREPFRHVSCIAAAAKGVISGFGLDSYRLAMESLLYA